MYRPLPVPTQPTPQYPPYVVKRVKDELAYLRKSIREANARIQELKNEYPGLDEEESDDDEPCDRNLIYHTAIPHEELDDLMPVYR